MLTAGRQYLPVHRPWSAPSDMAEDRLPAGSAGRRCLTAAAIGATKAHLACKKLDPREKLVRDTFTSATPLPPSLNAGVPPCGCAKDTGMNGNGLDIAGIWVAPRLFLRHLITCAAFII